MLSKGIIIMGQLVPNNTAYFANDNHNDAPRIEYQA